MPACSAHVSSRSRQLLRRDRWAPTARLERLKRGWSQTTLAYLAKLPQPLICLIETGRQNPTTDELHALGRALGISPASVLLKAVTVRDPEESDRSEPVEAKA